MGFDQYHEPPNELPEKTRTFAHIDRVTHRGGGRGKLRRAAISAGCGTRSAAFRSHLTPCASIRLRTRFSMHDPVGQDPNICVLEALDRLTAFQTTRKEGMDRASDRIENRIVVTHYVV